MSTEKNLSVVNTFFARLQAGASPDEVAALFTDHVDWDVPGATGVVAWVGKRQTPAEVADFYRTLSEKTQLVRFDVYSILPSETTTVVLGYFESLVVSSQKTIKSEFAMQIGVTDGRIDRYRFYEDSYAVAQAMS
ncbi:nuclear transport factor 2 family protein [Raoultella terrigena]|uniref:nuclear transport factor 2 family protein n=1 Tax=Raoultella terrigena TaxID=577 RepID=UPI00349FB5B0